MTKDYLKRLVRLVSSTAFFRVSVGLLIAQALWIALSSRYPMAFDEDFHMGVIRLYAHHPYPFWAGQPESADRFGAIARDPSYLYQYIMSFPYNVIAAFTGNQTVQVLLLRLLNIGLFASSLVLYRCLLLKSGASKAIVHLCILLFVLLPIVPLLAAQVNYDNLLLPVTAVALLLTLKFQRQLYKRHPDSLKTFVFLIITCLLACLVKYAFLPLFIGIMIFVFICVWRQYNRKNTDLNLIRLIKTSYKNISPVLRFGLLVGLVLAAGLFSERYLLNVIHYRTPVPDCGQILSIEKCKEYGPWVRDHNFAAVKTTASNNPIAYTHQWLYGMWLRTFFAIGGPPTNYQSWGPLVIPSLSAIGLVVTGVIAFVLKGRKVWRTYNTPALWLFAVMSSLYVVILWLDEYRAYLHTGQPVAINGRYLLPILLPIMLIGALSLNLLIKRWLALKVALATFAIICFIWGGGVLTYILRSNNAWYWQNSEIRVTNQSIRNVIGPLTPGFYLPVQFLH